MTDPDILNRLQLLFGVGKVFGPYRTGLSEHHKSYYRFSVSGAEAYAIMKAILPLMCSRRASVIAEHVRGYEAFKPTVYRLLHVESGLIEETENIRAWCKHRAFRPSNVNATISRGTPHRGWMRLS